MLQTFGITVNVGQERYLQSDDYSFAEEKAEIYWACFKELDIFYFYRFCNFV